MTEPSTPQFSAPVRPETITRELIAQIEKLPRRKEYLGGQLTSYVQLDNVLAVLAQADALATPLEDRHDA